MKKINIFYWTCTGMMLAVLTVGSVFDIIAHPNAVNQITRLGYPEYLGPFLGVARLLAVLAILVPGRPRLKEWAYAGLAFDMVGALYSLIAAAKPPVELIGVIVPMLFLSASYVLHHRRLAAGKA